MIGTLCVHARSLGRHFFQFCDHFRCCSDVSSTKRALGADTQDASLFFLQIDLGEFTGRGGKQGFCLIEILHGCRGIWLIHGHDTVCPSLPDPLLEGRA